MRRTETLIIGGGQAGLAMSRCLAVRGCDHIVLERGQVGERWKSERWDSLRMLTPRWQSRLPGWSYRGSDPRGYMSRLEVAEYLADYARSFSPPIETGVSVTSVERSDDSFKVVTTRGTWSASNVVIATGHCDRPQVPAFAARVSARVNQVVPTRYRNPDQLAEGGVLVVGASATGIQLAAEIARSGRPVTLSVGTHIRLPRRYRGRDILDWFEAAGILSERSTQVRDLAASRSQPSLQLIGSADGKSLDLRSLQALGVRLVGRTQGVAGADFQFANDLVASMGHAQAKMERQLDRVDRFIFLRGLDADTPSDDRPLPISPPNAPERLNLERQGIRTVLWATGYRRDYTWLRLPVLDDRGELLHDGGITQVPGLYALGLNFMRRRNSSFLDGVGQDAEELADHIVDRMSAQNASALCVNF